MCAYLCVSMYLHLFVDACDFEKKMCQCFVCLQFKKNKTYFSRAKLELWVSFLQNKRNSFCIIHKQQFSLHKKAYLCVGVCIELCVYCSDLAK